MYFHLNSALETQKEERGMAGSGIDSLFNPPWTLEKRKPQEFLASSKPNY